MTHDAHGPTVSLEEAQRIERETAEHLRKVRKLSLIVDLDQTIVHATVDPTVGEWITEGEAWEARQATRSQTQSEGSETTAVEDDEVNPNWEALKDVKKFRLGPEALGDPRYRGMKRHRKDKSVEQEGCMYYIKPRSVTFSLATLNNRTHVSSQSWMEGIPGGHGRKVRDACLHYGHSCLCRGSMRCH